MEFAPDGPLASCKKDWRIRQCNRSERTGAGSLELQAATARSTADRMGSSRGSGSFPPPEVM